MRLLFILPGSGAKPVGGYKVVYEYANHLSALGHTVEVAHGFDPNPQAGWLRNTLRYLKWRMHPDLWRPSAWFPVAPAVKLSLYRDIDALGAPRADAVVATAWETAAAVAALPAAAGRKYYLIQHFETWSGSREKILASWRLPLHKLMIAEWLRELARGIGEASSYLPNGLDQGRFFIEQPLTGRDSLRVGSLYHSLDWKGTADVMAAMELVLQFAPQARLVLFGATRPTQPLPSWVEFHFRPSASELRELYNSMAIFVSASWEEGWGLTPCEALLCGCAIAVSDNGGHREFADDGVTALTFPARQPAEIADAVRRLMADPVLRVRLAEQGGEAVRKFTWDKSTARLLGILQQGDAPTFSEFGDVIPDIIHER
jgi:glycosyltransferase involved in cell wall biosynthesis